MPSMVTNYQCPNCQGPLRFDSASGQLACDYCGGFFPVAEIEARQAPKDEAAAAEFRQGGEQRAQRQAGRGWDTSTLGSQWGADAAQMRAYNCPSCGAELLCDATTAATSCPYCGNPAVVPGQFGGTLKPDCVIPFRLDKAAAVEALKKHYIGKGKRFVPREFSDLNHIEQIQGVYVPFWLFDARAEAEVRFEATRSHTHRKGNYEITTTEHFDVFRAGGLSFDKVPVDASSRMPDDLMDSLEPYDYSGLMQFSMAYLPGFLADKYDVSAADSMKRADRRCEKSVVKALEDTVTGYETVSVASKRICLQRGKVHYALLPVWLLNTKWNGQDFLFAMNGQTGKMIGDLPVDKKRYWRTFAAIALPLAAALAALLLIP